MARNLPINIWLKNTPYSLLGETLVLASSDASTRQYFRITDKSGQSYLIMDAPPDQENSDDWLAIRSLLHQNNINVPHLFFSDIKQGYFLIEDFGHETLNQSLNKLEPSQKIILYKQAIGNLLKIQAISLNADLPTYNSLKLKNEMRLFLDWYLPHQGKKITQQQTSTFAVLFDLVVEQNLKEKRVLVHRDYHSRNIMIVNGSDQGIIDFQDALIGPISYDLVSLLNDAYVTFSSLDHETLLYYYWSKARELNLPVPSTCDDFFVHFHWMNIQRQLKVLGIFSRLAIRDKKPQYLAYLKGVHQCLLNSCKQFSSLDFLAEQLQKIMPQSHF